MGILFSSIRRRDFKVQITTGELNYAGTNANVWIQLEDEDKMVTQKTRLDNYFRNDFEAGQTDTFMISANGLSKPEKIACVAIWRDDWGIGPDWFLERIEIHDNVRRGIHYVFPVHRWISPNKTHKFYEFDDFIPSKDPQREHRAMHLQAKRNLYMYDKLASLPLPRQIKQLPNDEQFLAKYNKDFTTKVSIYKLQQVLVRYQTPKWNSIEHVESIFDRQNVFPRPVASLKKWQRDDWFGSQRIAGVNPTLITLCKEIPEKLDVQPAQLEKFLRGSTLADALRNKKIFIVDLKILDGVFSRDARKMVAPIALFYLTSDNDLLPICIQLYQQPGEENPVYFPDDGEYTWLLAKMYYNMADAQHHQSIAHLGLTHLLMEGFCVSAHRHLSQSHPIFRLLAPHFLYLLAINNLARKQLINEGGWVDRAMNVSVKGMLELVSRAFQEWDLNINGSIINEFKSRGVLEEDILPNYHYRTDAVALYKIIEEYVRDVVSFYYEKVEDLIGDEEIQAWANEMSTPLENGGLGIKGVPSSFTSIEHVVKVCTCIIATCSVQHAAVNFQQYEQYAFLPNYPGTLLGDPPLSKENITEEKIAQLLPSIDVMLDLVVITNVLSEQETKRLGDFEVEYLHNPEVLIFVEKFRSQLKQMHNRIVLRNKKSRTPFTWLDPEKIPNAISI